MVSPATGTTSPDRTSIRLENGSKVWFRDKTDGWLAGTVSHSGSQAKVAAHPVQAVPFEEVTLTTKEGRTYKVPLDDVEPEYFEPQKNGVEDMTKLVYLNEPAVLDNLRRRFFLKPPNIYTYSGKTTLVALNPYKQVPGLYETKTMHEYHNRAGGNKFVEARNLGPPHIFAVAEETYQKLMRMQVAHSFIVSGDSGAGKTETAKYVMRYLATVAGGLTRKDGEVGIEDRILRTNPILEAFGNAKTLVNNNSSRFGKFVMLDVNQEGKIEGAKIVNYLLEKARVVHQIDGERTYHIAYQLLKSANKAEVAKYHLAHLKFDMCPYLSSGNVKVQGIDDSADWKETTNAMEVLGMGQDQRDDVFKTVAAVLHLGSVTFFTAEGAEVASVTDSAHATSFSTLLSCDPKGLADALCYRTIRVGNEEVRKELNEDMARDSRDALAKALYSRLFDWIVARVNESIRPEHESDLFVGILDIYGFEVFEKNGFEQLCINYANEKLQQFYNEHVFKAEQEEYIAEGIEWTFIEFPDNSARVELIEKPPFGLLQLLNEECAFPKGSDKSFLDKVIKNNSKNEFFSRTNQHNKLSLTAFSIVHYAGEVVYDCANFLEKNKDLLHGDLVQFVSSSTSTFVQDLFQEDAAGQSQTTGGGGGKVQASKTVGYKFRDQLTDLMTMLRSTEPRFIRCIKPNMKQKPAMMEGEKVLAQMRHSGVLETIKIGRAWYPARIPYEEFCERFVLLVSDRSKIKTDPKGAARQLMDRVRLEEGQFQMGKTKIFLRTGQLEKFEDRLNEILSESAVIVQREYRRWSCMRMYAELLRRHRAALKIQTNGRGFVKRKQFLATKKSAVVIGRSYARHVWLRERSKAAISIQKNVKRRQAVAAYPALLAEHRLKYFSTKRIQRHYRRHYNTRVTAARRLQRMCRPWLNERHGSAKMIQRMYRAKAEKLRLREEAIQRENEKGLAGALRRTSRKFSFAVKKVMRKIERKLHEKNQKDTPTRPTSPDMASVVEEVLAVQEELEDYELQLDLPTKAEEEEELLKVGVINHDEVMVHLYEAADLRPGRYMKDSNASGHVWDFEGPMAVARADVGGSAQYTPALPSNKPTIWNHTIFFDESGVGDAKEMKIVVYDASSDVRDNVIGTCTVDLEEVYRGPFHEITHRWFALSPPVGSSREEYREGDMERLHSPSGYVKLSVSVLKKGDDVIERTHWEKSEPTVLLQPQSVVFPRDFVPREGVINIYVYQLEGLLKAVTYGEIGYYVTCHFGGRRIGQTRTIIVTSETLNPQFNEVFTIPIVLPAPSGKSFFSLSLWSWALDGEDREMGRIFVDITDPKVKSASDQTMWLNMYGPIDDELEEAPEDAYQGRLQVGVKVAFEDDPITANLKSEQSFFTPSAPPIESEKIEYCLRMDLLEGGGFVSSGTSFKLCVKVSLGPHAVTSTAQMSRGGLVTWYENLERLDLIFPKDPAEVPDIFIEVFAWPAKGDEEDAVRLGYIRTTADELLQSSPLDEDYRSQESEESRFVPGALGRLLNRRNSSSGLKEGIPPAEDGVEWHPMVYDISAYQELANVAAMTAGEYEGEEGGSMLSNRSHVSFSGLSMASATPRLASGSLSARSFSQMSQNPSSQPLGYGQAKASRTRQGNATPGRSSGLKTGMPTYKFNAPSSHQSASEGDVGSVINMHSARSTVSSSSGGSNASSSSWYTDSSSWKTRGSALNSFGKAADEPNPSLRYKLSFGPRTHMEAKPNKLFQEPSDSYILWVHLYQAVNLGPRGKVGLPDPYCLVRFGPCKVKSAQKHATNCPMWYSTLSLDCKLPKKIKKLDELKISIYHRDDPNDALLGWCTVPSWDIRSEFTRPRWYVLDGEFAETPTDAAVLASFQLFRAADFLGQVMPTLSPPIKECHLEVCILDLKDLVPERMERLKKVFLEIDAGGGAVKDFGRTKPVSVSNMNGGRGSSDASLLEILRIPLRLPEEPLFAPYVTVRLFEDLRPEREPHLLGFTSLPLEQLLPWRRRTALEVGMSRRATEFQHHPMMLVRGNSQSSLQQNSLSPLRMTPKHNHKATSPVSPNRGSAGLSGLRLSDATALARSPSPQGGDSNPAPPVPGMGGNAVVVVPPGAEEFEDQVSRQSQLVFADELENHFKLPFGIHNFFRREKGSNTLQEHRSHDHLRPVAALTGPVGKFKGRFVIVEDINTAPDISDLKARLDSVPCVARVYLIRAKNLKGFSGNTPNPYIVLKSIDDPNSNQIVDTEHQAVNTRDPEYFLMHELDVSIPGNSRIAIQIRDGTADPSVNLIGETWIELDHRWFSKQWRDLAQKPVEIRSLYHPTCCEPQGQVEMIVEIIRQSEREIIPPTPIEIPVREEFELRVVVWNVEDFATTYAAMHPRDVFVSVEYGGEIQETEFCPHFDGYGELNWRTIFKLTLPTDNPYLLLKLMAKPFDSGLEYLEEIGSVVVSLSSTLRKALCENASVMLEHQYVEVADHNIAPVDEEKRAFNGRMELTIEVFPKSEAQKFPAGLGRNEPNENPWLPRPRTRMKGEWEVNDEGHVVKRRGFFARLCGLGKN